MRYLESVQKAIDYIEKELGAAFDLEKIAEEAAMSLPHLYRMFYSLTGHPIKDYIRKRRISEASLHLKNSNRSILDIALEVGFESHASFSKTFKKIVGMPPGLYKKTDLIYCFDRINLFEKVRYLEEKELSERYPDVKVIRLAPIQVLTYRHAEVCAEGLERKALHAAQELIGQAGLEQTKLRFFGYNVEHAPQQKDHAHHYEIIIPVEKDVQDKLSKLRLESHTYNLLSFDGKNNTELVRHMKLDHFPGGLYAVGVTPVETDQTILSSWNRLLSEWLPKSTFVKGTHSYLEEFLTYNGEMIRMKLYLPLERKVQPDMIRFSHVSPFIVACSREYGKHAPEKADEYLTSWLEGGQYPGDMLDGRLYFSYNFGSSDGSENWYEYGVSINQEIEIRDSAIQTKQICGGEYASMQTKAYGSLIGVLEMMHRWIVGNGEYVLDDTRQWFAEYMVSSEYLSEEDIDVICYIPVIRIC